MKILRKYYDFKKLDGGGSFLDWITGQHLNFSLINSLCLSVLRESTSKRIQALGNFSLIHQRKSNRFSAPGAPSHPCPKQPGCNSLPLAQPERRLSMYSQKHTHLNTHTELCSSCWTPAPCSLVLCSPWPWLFSALATSTMITKKPKPLWCQNNQN